MSNSKVTAEMLKDATCEGVPILDFTDYRNGVPDALEKLALQLRHALENIGFFAVVNHGIPEEIIDGTFEQSRNFHALPIEKKMQLAMGAGYTGYLPSASYAIKTSEINDNKKPDLNGAFFTDRERSVDDPEVKAGKPFRELNKWPDDTDLPGFREKTIAYYDTMERFAKSLLPIFAKALDLKPDYFNHAFEGAQATVRLSHYPPSAYEENQFGIAPHTDANFLTILPQAKVEGLYIRPAGREWMKAPMLPGSLHINSGDMCKRWTNDRFLSTEHLAINPTRTDRYAIPFFYAPNTEYLVTCIETCCSDDNPPRYPPVTYEQYKAWFIKNNYNATIDKAATIAKP
jgi:isopenicillin N synthase-like dioxygenase